MVAEGPEMTVVKSTILMPLSGPDMFDSYFDVDHNVAGLGSSQRLFLP
jgi:hypothetical protein